MKTRREPIRSLGVWVTFGVIEFLVGAHHAGQRVVVGNADHGKTQIARLMHIGPRIRSAAQEPRDQRNLWKMESKKFIKVSGHMGCIPARGSWIPVDKKKKLYPYPFDCGKFDGINRLLTGIESATLSD